MAAVRPAAVADGGIRYVKITTFRRDCKTNASSFWAAAPKARLCGQTEHALGGDGKLGVRPLAYYDIYS